MQVVLTVILRRFCDGEVSLYTCQYFLNKELAKLLLSKEHFRSEYIETYIVFVISIFQSHNLLVTAK